MSEDHEPQNEKFDKSLVSSSAGPINSKFLLRIIAILLIVGLVMGYYLFSKGALNLPFLGRTNPVPGPLPDSVKAKVERDYNPTCDVAADGKLIVNASTIFENHRAITLKGTISEIKLVSEGVVSLLLTDDQGERSVQFNVNEVPNLVFKASNTNPIKLSELKVTDTLLVDYKCDPKTNSTPVINRIQKIN